MLEQVLRHIHNRFEYDSRSGTFTVSDRRLEIVGMQEGQYFWVEGSVFNDGLHRYPDRDMHDEEFEGRVVLLAVPRAVLDLADRIGKWCDEYSKTLDSPYQSESFGGYSYTMQSGSSSDGSPASAWAVKFSSELDPWRKMSHSGW